MSLWLEIILVAASMLALFAGSTLAARWLRLRGLKAQLAAMLVRLSLTLLVAVGLAVGGSEHRVALLFTVGATYFAAALADGLIGFRKVRNREADGCPTR